MLSTTRSVREILIALEAYQCDGSVIVHKTGPAGGVRIKNLGVSRFRSVVTFDGVQLVQRL